MQKIEMFQEQKREMMLMSFAESQRTKTEISFDSGSEVVNDFEDDPANHHINYFDSDNENDAPSITPMKRRRSITKSSEANMIPVYMSANYNSAQALKERDNYRSNKSKFTVNSGSYLYQSNDSFVVRLEDGNSANVADQLNQDDGDGDHVCLGADDDDQWTKSPIAGPLGFSQ